jgi:hypothetical protein
MRRKRQQPRLKGLSFEEYEKVAPASDRPELTALKKRIDPEKLKTFEFYPEQGLVEYDGHTYSSLFEVASRVGIVACGSGIGGHSPTDKALAAERAEKGGDIAFYGGRRGR